LLHSLAGLVIGVLACSALALEADRAISQYARRAWKIEDGLPNSVVRGIVQTDDGYIWLATYEGLARFNGDSFTRFDKKNLPALRRDTVLAVLKSRDGAIWAGTNGGGVGSLRGADTRVLTMADGLPSDIVAAVAEDARGTIWIGTSAGLCAYRNGKVEKAIIDDSVLSLAIAPDGALWIGTRGAGVLVASGGMVRTAGQLGQASVYSLLPERDGSVWAGTNRGLHRITTAAPAQLIDGIPQEQVTALLRDSDGTLWIGTYSNGLHRLANGQVSRFTTAEGLINNSVRSLFEDVEKNLWVGTNGGVASLTRGKFITIGGPEGLTNSYTRTVLEDRAGNIWIGTASGLTKFGSGDKVTYTAADGLSNDYILSVAEAPDGAMWIGTPTGLNRLANGKVEIFDETDGLASRTVRALFFDPAGMLWIGTDRGLNRYVNGRFEILVPGPKWDTTFVQAFAAGPDGSIWIGADGRGISRYKDGAFTSWAASEGLPDEHVLALHVDAAGTVWIGTDSAGLIRLKDGRFTSYTVDAGLWSEKVLQILEDDHGRMWFGGGRGIWSVGKRELEEVAAGRLKRVQPVVFGAGDGVRSVECNGSTYPAAMRSRDGRLWFATVDGAATIAPKDAIVRNLRPPPMRIESISIDGRAVTDLGGLIVPPDTQHVEIRYAALTYTSPEKVKFRYRLEGFDRDWIDAGDRRVAFYTGVPPGEYRFRAIAANADGVWNEEGAAVSMTFKPRFVQTVWFALLVLLLLGSVVWLIQQRRVHVSRRREKQLQEVVAERTREIESALIEAEAANKAKSIFLANVSHELRTPLNAIIGFAGVLLRDGDKTFTERQLKFVNNISVSGEHLLSLINDILDLAKVEAGKMSLDLERVSLDETLDSVARVLKGITIPRGIDIEFDLPPDLGVIVADGVKLKQILYNLVSNAVKFSPDKSTIRIAARKVPAADSPLRLDSISIAVIDRGIGIAPEHQQVIFEEFRQLHPAGTRRPHGTGLGLSLVRKFVELHGGVVQVESEYGRGSVFTVVLPERQLAVPPPARAVEVATA
jgi:signal transduction histidine kinase/ligand-binding sensor domain-containing protein